MSSIETKTKNEDVFLFIAFWLSLIVECVALFKGYYTVYGFSRILIVPVLLIRTIWLPNFRSINSFVYLSFICSLLADGATIFGYYATIEYIGLSLYAISYLSMACLFLQIKKNHNNAVLVFLLVSLLAAIISSLWLYSPELHNKIYYLQILFQASILLFLTHSVITAYLRRTNKGMKLYFFAVLLIIITNIIFGLDIIYFKRLHPSVDALVGLGNGLYLYLFTKASILVSKKA